MTARRVLGNVAVGAVLALFPIMVGVVIGYWFNVGAR